VKNKMVFEGITAAIFSALDFVFGPLQSLQPHIGLLIFSSILTLLILVLSRLVTNKKVMAEIKAKTNELKAKLDEAQKSNDKENVNKIMSEMMQQTNIQMKHSFKSIIVSLIIVSIFLPWAQHAYNGQTVATLPFSVPFIGSSLSWVYWYILVSFTVGLVMRKLMGFEQ